MPIYEQLIKTAQAWALRWEFDLEEAARLRRRALLANHAHYLEDIAVYRRFAQGEGIQQLDEVDTIQQRLMFPDDLFKSYNQVWLDEKNFARMNEWLSEIYHRCVEVDVRDVTSIDAWIERLGASGIRLVYSSGTSGNFSFVPRDKANWDLFRMASTAYILPLLMANKLGTPLQRLLTRAGCRLLSPHAFVSASHRMGARDYDAVFLDFSQGHTGNQTLEQELAPFFRKCHFLYQTGLSPSLLRLASRGPRTEEERSQLMSLQDLVANHKDDNYGRVIESLRGSTAEGQKVFIFGTTYQYKELCEAIAEHGETVRLKEGSLVLFGGGWKSFTGQRIARDQLIAMMSNALGLPEESILEGYSMTEINAFMLRCEHGRFHIPPFIEPVIFNEALIPISGNDMRGIFGFLDPFAIAYPGFIISGDEVHFVYGECACGLVGAAVTEIGRAAAREVKGCGGIMASLAA